MKQRIRLTESDLHGIIKESVKRVLNEISGFTAQSAGAKAQERYNNLSKGGQNSPYGQKLQRQINTFDQYNNVDANNANQFGRTQNDVLNDIIKAAGLRCTPEQLLTAYNKYESNGGQFNYQNMTQFDMEILQKALPIMNMNSQGDPRNYGMNYGGGKKGFLGFGKRSNSWTYGPRQ